MSALTLSGFLLNAVEVTRVARNKFLLHSLPGALTKRFIVKRPRYRNRHQQSADQHPAAAGATDNWILSRYIGILLD